MIPIKELGPEEAAREILGAELLRLVAERRVGRTGAQLTRLQRYVLMAVARLGPLPVSELVDLLEVGPTTASQFIKTLEERGWLFRSLDTRDRRRHLVALTEAGTHVLAQAQKRDRERLERLMRELAPDERASLVHLVHRVVEVLRTTPDLFRAGDPDV